LGGWYIVTKVIKGRPYLYRQRTWREGTRVRTQSQYIGPADGGVRPLSAAEAVSRWNAGGLCELTPTDLSEREYEAVRLYTGEAYKKTNGLLRGDNPMSELDAENSAALLSALMHPKARLKHDLSLYRRALVPAEAKAGETISDLAFMSFTVDYETARGHSCESREGFRRVILKIHAKAGVNGYISPKGVTSYDNEAEIIRYGGWFKIIDIVEKDGDLVYYIQDEGGYEIK
jgi:hypothetical protein